MMLQRVGLMLSLVCISAVVGTADEKPTLDLEKSKISFVGSKPDGKHDGGFKKFTADVVLNVEEPSEGSLKIEIDTTSLWSDDDKLTNHLKNPDFFDVRKHPKITFEATKIEHDPAEDSVKLVGKLTMLGKAVEVTIPALPRLTEEMLVLAANFDIDRTKWGMDYGKGKINDEVAIRALLVFKR
ncbi:YceI family protein [Rhodopirellula halodulae]|uniref:YceI family protein n=1 Tax=Rhodopirellula halodulae TaxID=2894198 RepID=UPI001E655A33|nr:YceI family protein [Rhodopirellula sp. JC737]MCC9656944.1 YceI family protein [Rhodopirellula sp. JC737]